MNRRQMPPGRTHWERTMSIVTLLCIVTTLLLVSTLSLNLVYTNLEPAALRLNPVANRKNRFRR
jgi:hypothetical protein